MVAERYKLVGLTEHMDLTVSLLVAAAPSWFRGLREVYAKMKLEGHDHQKQGALLAPRAQPFAATSPRPVSAPWLLAEAQGRLTALLMPQGCERCLACAPRIQPPRRPLRRICLALPGLALTRATPCPVPCTLFIAMVFIYRLSQN